LEAIRDNKAIEDWTVNEAYYKCYYELFDTGYIIWGCYGRLKGFFKDNAEYLREVLGL
jgi:hypothetical protein